MQMQNVSRANTNIHEFSDRLITTSKRERDSRSASIYHSLLVNNEPGFSERVQRYRSYSYLLTQLEAAEQIEVDVPDTAQALAAWMDENVKMVGSQYQSYIVSRKSGSPRRFFANKSQALHFLRAVAPTKLVDGAWLYGLLQQWRSPHVAPLIDIYLDEIGHGIAARNHVLLYKKLLADNGIDPTVKLSEAHYVQGAIQLSLAHHGDSFLPEILGFNLGYEQLPLHLLITAYELKELGIDPYYFTLHVTIDNSHSGHAQKALQGILELMPKMDDGGAFYRRVLRGYKLNFLGESTWSIIGSFNLENELVDMLGRKSELGKLMHADHRKIGNRTVNEWLSSPTQIRDFLTTLTRTGWIHRDDDPQKSRFWQLIANDNGVMAGVFTAAEQQLVYDWIAGEKNRTPANRFSAPTNGESAAPTNSNCELDLNSDADQLRQQLAELEGKDASIDHLVRYLSPSLHHTPVGLAATRIFSSLLR